MMGRTHSLLGVAGFSAMLTVAYKTGIDGIQLTESVHLPVSGHIATWSAFAIAAVSRVTLSNIPRELEQPLEDDEGKPVKASRKVLHGAHSGLYKAFHKILIFATLIFMTVFVGMLIGTYFPFMLPEGPLQIIFWVFVAAGWALFPDIDEPNSTVSRLFGPVSMLLSKGVRSAAGGHRVFTHQWPMVVVMAALAVFAAGWVPILAGVMMTIAIILSTRLLLPDSLGKQSIPVILIGVGFVWMATLGSVSLWPLVPAVACGILLHDMGDYVTNSGIAFAWPSKTKYAARLFSTGGFNEVWVVRPILTVLAVASLIYLVGIPLVNDTQPNDISGFLQNNYPGISSVMNGEG